MTTLRTPEYLPLVRELHCSLDQHNPGARLIVAAVENDLNATVIEEVRSFAEFRLVEDLKIDNTMSAPGGPEHACRLPL